MNVLWAVHVPGLDGEQDRSFDAAWKLRILQSFKQFRIVFHNSSRTPEFDTTAVDVIHQEDKRLGIIRQVSQRDVLSVASKVGESDDGLVQQLIELALVLGYEAGRRG